MSVRICDCEKGFHLSGGEACACRPGFEENPLAAAYGIRNALLIMAISALVVAGFIYVIASAT